MLADNVFRIEKNGKHTAEGRSRPFPAKPVFSPAFYAGSMSGVLVILSARFTGLLPVEREGAA